jgi:hypothetical protein
MEVSGAGADVIDAEIVDAEVVPASEGGQALAEIDASAPKGVGKMIAAGAPLLLALTAPDAAAAFKAPTVVRYNPASVGPVAHTARYNPLVMSDLSDDAGLTQPAGSEVAPNKVEELTPSDMESPCDDMEPAIADDSQVTGSTLRSIALKDASGAMVEMAEAMGDGKSVVVFLRHLG